MLWEDHLDVFVEITFDLSKDRSIDAVSIDRFLHGRSIERDGSRHESGQKVTYTNLVAI